MTWRAIQERSGQEERDRWRGSQWGHDRWRAMSARPCAAAGTVTASVDMEIVLAMPRWPPFNMVPKQKIADSTQEKFTGPTAGAYTHPLLSST